MVFFMGGPQLGELEAGLVANAFGAVASVVSGGLGCVAATIWIVSTTPALRLYRASEQPEILPENTRTAAHAGQPE
ncbi:MAG TPA: hypothetical protein VH458_16645, partial [Vicinamibacterales bacterium]